MEQENRIEVEESSSTLLFYPTIAVLMRSTDWARPAFRRTGGTFNGRHRVQFDFVYKRIGGRFLNNPHSKKTEALRIIAFAGQRLTSGRITTISGLQWPVPSLCSSVINAGDLSGESELHSQCGRRPSSRLSASIGIARARSRITRIY